MVDGLTMGAAQHDELIRRLSRDPDVGPTGLVIGTDRRLSIGADVVRLVWQRQIATAVDESADLPTTCGALLDALALLLHPSSPLTPEDRSTINVLIDRPLPGQAPREVDDAVRSVRVAIGGLTARTWYRGDSNRPWVEDTSPPPDFGDSPRVDEWVQELLLPRLHTQPEGLAVAMIREVNDASLQLYPAPISASVPDRWSLRLDGLEIGTVSSTRGVLTVGKQRRNRVGPQRSAWLHVADGAGSVPFTTHGAGGTQTLHEAVGLVRRFAEHWRSKSMPIAVPGAPVCHRVLPGGASYVDEHALEARLLKGIVTLPDHPEARLVMNDDKVARGSQFPTLWTKEGDARYLDALLGDDRTPLAVELKVPSGGQGRYYRRALIQAVLYRHFIASAPGLDPWFEAAGLDRLGVRGLIGIPEPVRWTVSFGEDLAILRDIAERLGIPVEVLDDRRTPDLPMSDLAEPTSDEVERLSWSLAAALSRRWPSSLGNVIHDTSGGGDQYNTLWLQARGDQRTDGPSALPRISLNRPGSARVHSHRGTERWVWRDIWSALHGGLDPDEAAATIGSIAGLLPDKPQGGPTFAEIAAALVDLTPGLHWVCAWNVGTGDTHVGNGIPNFAAFEHATSRYGRSAATDRVPTLGRIWYAVDRVTAIAAIDQATLRAWALADRGTVEVDLRTLATADAALALRWEHSRRGQPSD